MPLRLLFVALLVAIACRSDSNPFGLQEAAFTPATDAVQGSGTVEELRARRDAWLATRPRNYFVQEQLGCFCGDGPDFRPAILEVRNGEVTRAWGMRTGKRFTPRKGALQSVEQLFDEAIAYAERGSRVVVKYDRLRGYPVVLILGTPENDGGVIYSLGRLSRL